MTAQAGHLTPRDNGFRGMVASATSIVLACAVCFVSDGIAHGQEPTPPPTENRMVVNGATTIKEIADFLIAAMWQNHRPVIEFDVSFGEMLKAKVR